MAKKRDIYLMSNGAPVTEGSVSQICGVIDKSDALTWWAAKKACEHVAEHWLPGKPFEKYYIDTVLKEAKSAHKRYKDTAADIGTRIHKIVGAYVEGQLLPEHVRAEDEKRGLENFIKVTKDWKWLGSEVTLINEWCECNDGSGTTCADLSKCPNLRGYGGTADGFAQLPSGMYILPDFKTSNHVVATYTMQCRLYADARPVGDGAHLAELWKKIEEARILHFDKELLTWEVLERDIRAQAPYVMPFIMAARWKKKYDIKSDSTYERKPVQVDVSASAISIPSSSPPPPVTAPAAPMKEVWMK